MQRERLQQWADSIRFDPQEVYNLSRYDTCASALALKNPEFNKLGFLRAGVFEDIPVYHGREGLLAIADFFEITTDDAARLTHVEEFSADERDDNGHVFKDAILARLTALIGVPV